jgi:hypothetical protein
MLAVIETSIMTSYTGIYHPNADCSTSDDLGCFNTTGEEGSPHVTKATSTAARIKIADANASSSLLL